MAETFKIHLIGSRAAAAFAKVAEHQALVAKGKALAKDAPKPPSQFDGFSGRGVRFRILEGSEKRDANLCAAKECPEGAGFTEYNIIRNAECVRRMLVSVTKQAGLSPAQLQELKADAWQPLTLELLETPEGPWSLDKIFTAKDRDLLTATFSRYHDATSEDVEAALGKVMEETD